MKKILFISCICIVIFSCNKKEIPVPIDYTYNFTEPVNNPQGSLNLDCSPGQIDYLNLDQYVYSRPIFNPTNPNEIAYLRRPWGENECNDEIWTFNFKTGRTNKVTSRKVCRIDWGILNWIAFITNNGEAWKIKSNGSESNKLSPNGGFSSLVKISPQGNQFLVDGQSLISFGTIKTIIDLEGNSIQQLPALEFEYFSEMDWRDDKIVFPRTSKIGLYDISKDTIFRIETMETQGFSGMNNVQFFSDNEVLFLLEKSIHKMDLDTEEKTLIKSNGSNDWFINFDISLDKKTILVHKQDFVKINECTVQVRSYLAMMDIDGTNERRILIPE